jgi:hypothetical protein
MELYIVLAATHITALTPLAAPVIWIDLTRSLFLLQTKLMERFTTHIAVHHLKQFI